MTSSNETTRAKFPDKLARQVQEQFLGFSNKDMSAYTFERTRSDFYEAKYDLSVYDSDGKLRLLGRDFGSRIFFWEP